MKEREKDLSNQQLQIKAQICKALGHPSRLRMVSELAAGERWVYELTALVRADKSTVSKHLSILKQAGILQDEKRGNMVYYAIAAPCVLNFLACLDGIIERKNKESGGGSE